MLMNKILICTILTASIFAVVGCGESVKNVEGVQDIEGVEGVDDVKDVAGVKSIEVSSPFDDNSSIHSIVRDGKLDELKELIKKKPEYINSKTKKFGITPLHVAATIGNDSMIQVLLDNKADINLKDKSGSTALHDAARKGHESVVKILIKHGTNIDEKRNRGKTPLHVAVENNHENIVKLILENEGNVNSKNEYGDTPLHIAVNKSVDLELIKLLLDNGADLENHNSAEKTPLFQTLWEGKIDIAKLLLKHGAKKDGKTDDMSYLHWAASMGQREMVELFLEQGLDVNNKNDKYGFTPLHWASRNGKVEMVQFLILKGADINAKASDGETPLHFAAKKGHKNVVKKLLEANANVNVVSNFGWTPFQNSDDKEIDELLLKYGAKYLKKPERREFTVIIPKQE